MHIKSLAMYLESGYCCQTWRCTLKFKMWRSKSPKKGLTDACPFSVFGFEISRSFKVVSGSSILSRGFSPIIFGSDFNGNPRAPCCLAAKVGFPNTGRGWCCLLAQLYLYSQRPESGLQDLLLTYTVHPRNWTTTCFFNGVLIFSYQ